MNIRKITQFEEIKHMILAAPDFFPKSQQELDACFMYVLDDFCYAGIKKINHHPSIAEVEIISNGSQKKMLNPTVFMILLQLVQRIGFSRMAMWFQNERLKQICLRKSWIVPWGNGLYLNKEGV